MRFMSQELDPYNDDDIQSVRYGYVDFVIGKVEDWLVWWNGEEWVGQRTDCYPRVVGSPSSWETSAGHSLHSNYSLIPPKVSVCANCDYIFEGIDYLCISCRDA